MITEVSYHKGKYQETTTYDTIREATAYSAYARLKMGEQRSSIMSDIHSNNLAFSNAIAELIEGLDKDTYEASVGDFTFIYATRGESLKAYVDSFTYPKPTLEQVRGYVNG